MPQVTLDLMTGDEKDELSRAAQEILIAQADGYCRLDLGEGPDGTLLIRRQNGARGRRGEYLDEALMTVQAFLDEGKAAVTLRKGRPLVEPAVINRTHHYPAAHMTGAEEEEFNAAVMTVNHAVRMRRCRFESFLDEWAHIGFRYAVEDDAADRQEIFQAIDLVIRMVHDGRAVRIPMPGGGVMLMPRWPAAARPASGEDATGVRRKDGPPEPGRSPGGTAGGDESPG